MAARGATIQAGRTTAGFVIIGLMLFPLYWMANASMLPQQILVHPTPTWIPDPPIWDGYRNAFELQTANVAVSFVVAGLAAIFSLIVATPCAYALIVFRMRWATAFIAALLLVQMIPHVVMANALYVIYAKIGLLNSYAGLVLADSTMGIPFAILILRAFMLSLPRTLTEAALIDGTGYWGAFFRIVLPLSRNGLITAGLFCFLFAWSDFIFALTLLTKQPVVPITLGIYQFIGIHRTDWTTIMATAVMASVPPVILLLFAQNYISAGLTGGAIKE